MAEILHRLRYDLDLLVMGVAGYASQCLRESDGKKYVILRD